MKNWSALIMLFFLLSQCNNSEPINNEICDVQDARFVGAWKLVEECQCYSLGGDFKWKAVSEDLTFIFNDKCALVQTGSGSSPCVHGKYTSNQDQLKIVFACSDGSTSTNDYSYSFSTNTDTLTLEGPVDEGFVGSKLLRQK